MKVRMKDGSVTECKFEEELGSEAFWHTASHVLAQAVKRIYPSAKCAIGSATKDGFYYDFEFDFIFSDSHLKSIENEMKKVIKENLIARRVEFSRDDAMSLMSEKNESYKIMLINDMPAEEKVICYELGEYSDLCTGPYISNANLIKAVQLTTIAGAYWKGNEKNKMLTRIYGVAFPKVNQLEEYLKLQEEIKRRDHRKLGKELGLFALMEEGPGFPFFLPKGMILKNLLINYWREIHEREGYCEISTPIILNRDLWQTSGHWDHYRENMYTTVIEDMDYAIKPMNCPGGMLVYKQQPHSYRDLPIRIGELGLVHRYEKSGVLHGLMRARSFTQDDAHIFMTQEQITEEIMNVIRIIDEMYIKFGFNYNVELSTRPENSIGSDEDWEVATESLKKALELTGKEYVINEGDGAFYGPKIDFHLEDSMGRTWQCGSIQLDFQLPLRFGAEYIGADGERHRPIMIHRVVFGSIERFIGILIEHYAGKFPLWLAPVQVKVLPISDRFFSYGEEVMHALKKNGIRCEIDSRNEKIGYKIREAQLDKVPYMVVVGQKEMESGTVSVRKSDSKDLEQMEMSEFIERLKSEMAVDR
ncbi:threonine--tRNA ligase [Lacrimispora amygdalina]|uniref:threonine--tRNA ligase n=1 Tax=Lacrimispora amygdalina TaxID=253257 RepID=UPI000BE3626E|nr:threonine--tRNA ligase [Lacrimispora amygdalina]